MFNRRQTLAEKARIIRKKGYFSDLEIVAICGQVNSEEYEEDPPTRIKTLNTEEEEPSN